MLEGFFLGGGHACGILFNLSKVTVNAIITIKLLIFSTSSVMLLSGVTSEVDCFHILLGGGSFKECKLKIFRPIF